MNKIALPVLIWNGLWKGTWSTIAAPYVIFKTFSGQEYYNWFAWPAILFATAAQWSCIFSFVKHGYTSYWMTVTPFVALVGWPFWTFANAFDKSNGFLGWKPGQGRLRSWIGGTAPVMAAGSGAAKSDETLLRGAAIVPGAALAAQLKRGASAADLAGVIEWGGVPIPPKSEPEHFLIEGKTGAGKTQAINEMMRKVRQRDQAAIIADPAGGYLGRFGREGDIVLNPFDRRTVDWSPFAEIEAEYDYRRIAKAAIPDGIGENEQWTNHAQVLFAECMRVMYKRGERSVKKLLYYVTAADQKELADLLGDSPAAVLTKQGNERMLGSVRSSAGTPLANWVYLADEGTFSVRKWVRESDTSHTWLFLTYTDAQMAELRNLVACWLELAIVEGLSMTESQLRRLWYVMDELDSLGKITSLRAGLTKLRKYGGVCVSGLQTIAQLRSTYGHDEAQTLLSCMTTKLILKAGDGETAKYFENEIGQQEVEREEVSEGTSQRIGDLGSSSENKSVKRNTQAAVLASQITGLENLHGFLMLTGLPIAKVQLDYVPMPDINAPYQAK
ncbi:type IV secretion system DNA-binding domain-containing protein [Duganella callida]|uniref:Type IV secretion system coupling protein TraD DNA-binding domain-containing protein n=1 Tax=Duganella callida TaxID=2561932 RepID=A0A4Y9S1T8_9BURK|nr:type IV secretion system DNA-binding domain-containing protein [Duganella callida]TFW15457.1 hypothetical protein E4L98_26625 [Duganella callida]